MFKNKETCNIIHTEVNSSYEGQGISKKVSKKYHNKCKKHNKISITECLHAKKY